MKPLWRLADHDAGSDVGVTFAAPRPADDADCEPDQPVFSVHVWHAGTDQCQAFARDLCEQMNINRIQPPEGWDK